METSWNASRKSCCCLAASPPHRHITVLYFAPASWLFGEPHSVVLLDGQHPHRHPQLSMLGSEHSSTGVWWCVRVCFGALRSFACKGRQRPVTSLGTTGGMQWGSIIVILYLNAGKDILFDVATSAGFEPATCPLGGGCSIQLSHEAAGRPGGT